MYGDFQQHLRDELAAIDAAGLTKRERELATPRAPMWAWRTTARC